MKLQFKNTDHNLSCVLNYIDVTGIEILIGIDPSDTVGMEDMLYLATKVAIEYEITPRLDVYGQCDFLRCRIKFALEDIKSMKG